MSFASFPSGHIHVQDSLNNKKTTTSRTIKYHPYVVVDTVRDHQYFRYRHPRLLLRKCIQPLEGILDFILSQ